MKIKIAMQYKSLFLALILPMPFMVRAQGAADTAGIRTLIFFFDGLRPDYITQKDMPNLYAFSQRGCYGKQHHSVFPTVTRVNASSYSTGSYPATHGLMGNTVYFPEVNRKKGLNTGDAADLNKVAVSTHGHLLTEISMGEVLQKAGAGMMVFSSGSTGQALLQNHTLSGGAIINPAMILPDSLRTILVKELGPIPPAGDPNTARHKWVTDALIRYGLVLNGPLVSAIWLSDPDGTAHRDGIGAATSMESIRVVDEQFGRVIAALKEKHLENNFNIIVSTDHGFVTHIGKNNVTDFLIKQGLKKDKESEDVVVAEGAVYVADHDPVRIRRIVSALQAQDWIGAIFTRGSHPGDLKGSVEGTVSFEAIHWNHPQRAADVLVDYNWDASKNTFGYEGATYSGGVAGHGSFSPYEVHIALLAAGPSFKKAYSSELPTSNVDIMPTVLHIHHIDIPVTADGRVMSELLVENSKTPAPPVKKETIMTSAKYEDGTYTLSVERTLLGKYKYVDYSKVTRVTKSAATTGK
jgi:predicted AlkP superfamily pyrophosphatase or phosphodiesterase